MFTITEYIGKNEPVISKFNPGSKIYTIGRDPKCDKILDNEHISRIHCQLVPSGSDWILYDGNPNVAGWLNKRPTITVDGHSSKTITMLPGTTATLISAPPYPDKSKPAYRATLEREERRKIVTTDPTRDTLNIEVVTAAMIMGILDNFIDELKTTLSPIMAENKEIGEKLTQESHERKESDRLSKREFEAFKKPVLIAAGIVLIISTVNIFNGDKEVITKVLDVAIAVITSGVLVKAASK